MSDEQGLIPVEQQTLTFNGKPIMVVQLSNEQAGVIIRFLCENLGLDTPGQIQRIQRTEVIADDLVYTQVETDGGIQRMAALEGLEAITDLIPDILEHLGPVLITVEHQRAVQGLVKRLHDATGKPFGTIYDERKTAFDVPRYQELHEQDWDKVLHWFTVLIERAKGKR